LRVATFYDLPGIPKPGKARRVGKRILERLSLWKYDPARTPEWLAGIEDAKYTDSVVAALVESLVPDYAVPSTAEFHIHSENGSYFVDTNIDFEGANEIYRGAHPDSTLTPALILSYLYGGVAHRSHGCRARFRTRH
jgi:hypothetical protein